MTSARASMLSNRRRDTAPELALRSILHREGFRYRVDYRVGDGPGAPRPDIAFTRQRVAIFVDGCFWHCCPLHATRPKSNQAFWDEKLARNVERDKDNDRVLREMGWFVMRVWEHEAPAQAVARIIDVVEARQSCAPRGS